MNNPDASMQFTDWLAVYAAILSTLTIVFNWYSSRPRMRVELLPGMTNDMGNAACIVISNPSGKTLHVRAVGLLYFYRRYSMGELAKDILRFRHWSRWWGWCHASTGDEETGLPAAIEAHSSHRVFVPKAHLDQMLQGAITKRFAAYAQDALGRNRYSNVLDSKWI